MSQPSNPSSPFLKARQQASQPINQPSGSPAVVPMVQITADELAEAIPEQFRDSIDQNMVQLMNNIATDELIAENFRNNLVSFGRVLKEGKFTVEEYINAVAYVSYKVMGYNNEDAYAKALPHRYHRLISKGTSKKDISSYVYAYNKGILVNLILEQTLVPTWILNADFYQKAINTQVELMMTANSELVRQKAADSILTHLKKPETAKLDITVKEDNSGMKEMRNMLIELARRQKEVIDEGKMKTIDIAASKIGD